MIDDSRTISLTTMPRYCVVYAHENRWLTDLYTPYKVHNGEIVVEENIKQQIEDTGPQLEW